MTVLFAGDPHGAIVMLGIAACFTGVVILTATTGNIGLLLPRARDAMAALPVATPANEH